MRKPASLRPAYLDTLGFRSEGELLTQVISDIREAICDQQGDIIPVAVSAAAVAFDVRPKPIMVAMPKDGAIQFDPSEGRFVIRINQTFSRSANSLMDFEEDHYFPDLSLYYRSRFTYAHEFAHRFFFVSAASAWQRAIDIATQGLQSDVRRIAIRSLSNYEETLCNRIAGDILVPETHLIRVFGGALWKLDTLHLALRNSAHTFRVSQECLLVRLKRALLHSQLSGPPNLCIFAVIRSDRKGGETRARHELRIREAILPSKISGAKVSSVFPGLALRNLGQEALSTAEAILASETKGYRLPINFQITLATTGGTDLITTRLMGWASHLYSDGGAQEKAKGLLIWGLLEPV